MYVGAQALLRVKNRTQRRNTAALRRDATIANKLRGCASLLSRTSSRPLLSYAPLTFRFNYLTPALRHRIVEFTAGRRDCHMAPCACLGAYLVRSRDPVHDPKEPQVSPVLLSSRDPHGKKRAQELQQRERQGRRTGNQRGTVMGWQRRHIPFSERRPSSSMAPRGRKRSPL